ncbi:Uncharacterized conserved protein%2C contains FHA domain [uncultured Roseburia sp.]|nr:Uncharacterized conserved protein%2C contains FHA domain [uncultured Roseburia sp.]
MDEGAAARALEECKVRIEYKKNLNESFMILKDAEYSYENYELLMLLNNRIPGCLEVQIIISDGKIEYWYEITGMSSLDTLSELHNNIEASCIRRVIEDLYDTNQNLREYLLDGMNICYLPEMIYLDRSTGRYRFCYLPGGHKNGDLRLQGLMEYILTKIDHTDREAVRMGYDLYEKSTQECCSVRELLHCVNLPQKKEAVKTDIQTDIEEKKENMQREVNSRHEEKHGGRKVISELKKHLFGGGERKADKSGKTVYGEVLRQLAETDYVAEEYQTETPTVLLNLEKQLVISSLIYSGNGHEKDFLLEEEVFLIGKDPKKVQGVIGSASISRVHARIIRKNGDYYIEDLNSTNGTFVNGQELAYRQAIVLEKNDRILFADEEYIFC